MYSEGLSLNMFLIRVKWDLCRVTGMIFCCCQDVDGFKNVFDALMVSNLPFLSPNILLSKIFKFKGANWSTSV